MGAGVGGGGLIEAFVREAAEYHRLKLSELFRTDPPETLRQTAEFDLDAFLTAAREHHDVIDLRRFRTDRPQMREFVLTPRQQRTISVCLRQFGTTPWGVGRLLTKVRLPDIVREVRTSPGPGAVPVPAGTGTIQ